MTLMDIAFVIVAIGTLLVAVLQVGRLVSTWRAGGSRVQPELDAEVLALRDRKTHLLEDLRDLEMDYRMGRLTETDYRAQRARIEPVAVSVLKELERRTGREVAGEDAA